MSTFKIYGPDYKISHRDTEAQSIMIFIISVSLRLRGKIFFFLTYPQETCVKINISGVQHDV